MNIPGRRINQNEVVVTDAFPRGGDGMILRVQLMDTGGTAGNTTVAVFTRNREDDWPATSLASLTVGTTDGSVYQLVVAPGGIKEELRLKVTGPTDAGWSLLRILKPVFYDSAIGAL